MSRIIPITVVACALALAACQAPETTNTTASVPANGPAADSGKATPDVGPSALAITGADYVHMASQADMFEIQASQLALQKSTNPKVRDLAQQLIGNQNSDTQILTTAAKAANPNMVMMTALDPRPAALLQGLQVEPVGAAFDKKFLASQLRVQREAWALHSGYAQSGDTQILREAASRIEPRARQQLGAVEQLVATGGM